MADTAFVVCGILYFVLSSKIYQWQSIQRMGFASETPLAFLRSPAVYHYASWALLAGASVALYFAQGIPKWVGIAGIIMAWIGTGVKGRSAAIASYRECIRDVLSFTDDESEKANLENELRKSDAELFQQYMLGQGRR